MIYRKARQSPLPGPIGLEIRVSGLGPEKLEGFAELLVIFKALLLDTSKAVYLKRYVLSGLDSKDPTIEVQIRNPNREAHLSQDCPGA